MHRRYGSVISLKLFHQPLVLIQEAGLAKAILKDPSFHKSRLVFDKIVPVTGERGLVQLEDPLWERRHKIIKPAFTPQALQQAIECIGTNLSRLLDKLDGELVNLHQLISRYTLENILLILGFEALPEITELLKTFIDLNGLCGRKMRELLPLPRLIPTKLNRQIKDRQRHLHAILRELIQEQPVRGGSFIDLLQAAVSAEEVIEQLSTFLFAGFETTASSLTMSLHQLARSPALQEVLYDECRENPLATLDDLKQLPGIRSCYLETLRLYPPAYMLVREPTKEGLLDGISFRRGQLVVINLYGLHRDPYYWEAPREFRPDRFRQQSAFQNEAFMPFGNGKRICTGNQLALFESQLTLARVVKEFKLHSDDEVGPAMSALITLHPRNNLWIKFERR